MSAGVLYATGWWCWECQVFEDHQSNDDPSQDYCPACGCLTLDHRRVEVRGI